MRICMYNSNRRAFQWKTMDEILINRRCYIDRWHKSYHFTVSFFYPTVSDTHVVRKPNRGGMSDMRHFANCLSIRLCLSSAHAYTTQWLDCWCCCCSWIIFHSWFIAYCKRCDRRIFQYRCGFNINL